MKKTNVSKSKRKVKIVHCTCNVRLHILILNHGQLVFFQVFSFSRISKVNQLFNLFLSTL